MWAGVRGVGFVLTRSRGGHRQSHNRGAAPGGSGEHRVPPPCGRRHPRPGGSGWPGGRADGASPEPPGRAGGAGGRAGRAGAGSPGGARHRARAGHVPRGGHPEAAAVAGGRQPRHLEPVAATGGGGGSAVHSGAPRGPRAAAGRRRADGTGARRRVGHHGALDAHPASDVPRLQRRVPAHGVGVGPAGPAPAERHPERGQGRRGGRHALVVRADRAAAGACRARAGGPRTDAGTGRCTRPSPSS